MTGSYFRVEIDRMHDLAERLDSSQENLEDLLSALTNCAFEGCGHEALDEAIDGFAEHISEDVDKVSKYISGVVERLTAAITTYEEVDHGYADIFGPVPGAAGGASAGTASGSTVPDTNWGDSLSDYGISDALGGVSGAADA